MLDIFGLEICTADFLWTIVSFFLFMFLLNKILFKPVLKLMDERKARIDADLEKGKQARAALKENEAQLAQELVQTGADARGVINSARSEAEKAKGEVLDAAHAQAEKLHKGVRERVKAQEKAAESEIDGSMPELVAILSDRLLGSEAANDKELIAECIKTNAQ